MLNKKFEGFTIDLKTFLGFAIPNQCSLPVKSKGFGVIIWGQNSPTFMIPIWSTIVLYDITYHWFV